MGLRGTMFGALKNINKGHRRLETEVIEYFFLNREFVTILHRLKENIKLSQQHT